MEYTIVLLIDCSILEGPEILPHVESFLVLMFCHDICHQSLNVSVGVSGQFGCSRCQLKIRSARVQDLIDHDERRLSTRTETHDIE